mgnify:CR=1 FL=1
MLTRVITCCTISGILALGSFPTFGSDDGFVHGISLLHDLKYPKGFKHFDYVNPEAPKGGTFVGYGTADVRNFGGDWSNEIEPAVGWERIYDRLIVRSADELAGYYGSLAEGMRLSEDHKSLTFRLHRTATFHDGVPVTSRDVKYSFEQAMATVDGTLFLDWIKSVTVLNDHEIRVDLVEPLTNSNLLLLSYAPRILPYHYWKDRPDPSKTTLEPPLGSGPYKFADFDKDYVNYERVDDYWGQSIPVNVGRNNFDVIRFEIYRDTTVTREAIKKGLLDFYIEPDIRHWVRSYDTPAAQQGLMRKEELYIRDSTGPQFTVVFNTRRELFADPLVREALALAFDFEWQNRALWYDSQVRAQSYFAASRFAATGLPDEAELELLRPHADRIPSRVFTQPFQMPVSTGEGRNRAALGRALDLFHEAGWQLEGDRLMNTKGRIFEFEFLLPSPDQQRIVLPYVDTLRRLGISVHLRVVESAQWINLMQNFDYDVFLQGHSTSQPPIMMLPFYFHSTAAAKPLTYNKAGINDPVVDALITQAQQAVRLEDIITACRALDRVLLWSFYHVPLQQLEPPRLIYWDRFGRPEGERSAEHQQPVDFIDLWWYDKDRAARVEATLSAH